MSQLTIVDYLKKDDIKNKMMAVMPSHLSYDRITQLALTEIKKSPKLLQCSPSSLLSCIFTASSLGLEVGEQMGKAYLIPFKDKCTLIIGYKGYIDLLSRSGLIKNITPLVIYENEEYDIQEGANPVFMHKPLFRDKGEPVCFYIRVKFTDGTTHIEHMSVDEILEVKAGSKGYHASKKFGKPHPWDTHFNEMAKKTVLRRFVKYFPIFNEQSNSLKEAVTVDEMCEAGLSEQAFKDMGDIDYTIEQESDKTNIQDIQTYESEVIENVG